MSELSQLHRENIQLREENRALKKELGIFKGEPCNAKNIPSSIITVEEVNEMRDTIKKEVGHNKELMTRIEILSRQCKAYEDDIEVMERKIKKLIQENNELTSKVDEYKIKEGPIQMRKTTLDDMLEEMTSSKLNNRLNEVTEAYTNLERRMEENEEDWELYKEQWQMEKLYYLNRIHDLEILMGLGIMSLKDSQKK